MSNTKQSPNLMSKCNGTKYTKYVKLLKNLYILTALTKTRNFKAAGCQFSISIPLPSDFNVKWLKCSTLDLSWTQ